MWTSLTLETVCELRKVLRMPTFAAMAIGFPVAFYLMFGVALANSRAMGGRSLAVPLLGTYGAFGVIGAALFTFGVGVAVERAQGWLLLKRATPMPALVYVLGKTLASLVVCAIIVAALALAAAAVGGVRLAVSQWTLLALALTVGSIPFCALGLAVGFLVGPNSAPGVVNLLHLPAAFASGLWMPLHLLPQFFQSMAPWLPQYHLGQLALCAIGQSETPRPLSNVCGLAAWTVVAVAAAAWGFRRDEGRTYG